MNRTSGVPIAVVGMACRFPGADSVARYWQLLREGRHAFREPPPDRWDHAAFFSTSHRDPDRYYVPTGAFVDDIRSFAALEFGIPPRRVEVMDPQQRLTIEVGHHALQDAGYAVAGDAGGRPLDRSRVGTWIGLCATEYRTLLASRVTAALIAVGQFGDAVEDDAASEALARGVSRVVPTRPFSAPGVLGNMSAAAVAQELDLGGPAFTVDAACASALVAVHDAVTYLRDGQVDVALAGGVYLNLTPENLIVFSRIGAISASGVCRPFDARSDGFVQGEGVGMVVLKRLDDALRDGDRVYAVIRGSAVNNDGKGDGPMAPRAEGQSAVIAAAWADAGIGPDRVGYVETHGTGTSVGDRTELTALRERLAGRRGPVPLGSAKANIGHTMSAAGIAGLMKAALAVYHRTIPPLANWEAPHPEHALDDGVFTIPTVATPWASETSRVATVSSFGFGGTNAHVVIEEAPPAPPARVVPVRAALPPLAAVLVTVSADEATLLARHLAELAETLDACGADLAAVAHTLNARRPRAVRAAVVAGSLDELAARMKKAAAALEKDPGFRGNVDRDTVIGDAAAPLPVAFLCPGQGMQKVGLLRDWLAIPAFAETLREMEAAVADLTPRPLRDYLYAPDATDEGLTDTAIAQPAMFAIGLGVARVLERLGVEPAVVLGHSLGEFTASAVCGAVDPAQAIRFVASRGRAMSDLPGDHGAMAACMAAAEEIAPLLPEGVVLANLNHPRQNVISGPTSAVLAAVDRLNAAGIKARRIPVSHAFHSPMLEAVQADVERGLGQTTFGEPKRYMASCIAAEPPTDAEAVRAIYRRHATSPVDFVRGLKQCRDRGARIYVQLCSGATLTAFARGVLEDGESIVSVAADDADRGLGLLRVLALAWAHGHPVDRSAFGAGLATLPPTPLVTQEWWGVQRQSRSAPQLARASRSAAVEVPPPAAPAPFPVDAPAVEDVSTRVLHLIARVSAFPADALRLDQRLIDDLGFDSLMANELSNRLGESFPGFPGIPRALFAQSPTVADLVRHVEGSRGGGEIALTDPARPLELKRPTRIPAPLSGFPGPGARVLDRPDLPTLRRLAPGPVVVRVDALFGADAAVAGFVKALAREWPDHKVCVLEGTLAEAQAEAAAAEHDVEVVYRDGVRHVVGLEPVEPPPFDLRGQTVAISGGTGWLGRVFARALLDAGASEVVLIGSRADAGDALAELGAAARYVRADLLADDLSGLSGLRIAGLVHAAGLLADGPVGKVDGDRAYAVKVRGLRRLAAALPELRWVTAIGSYAGRFGNAFQTEYAAANNALVAEVAALRAAGLHAQVQVWGPWAGSTMVGTIPTAVKRAMREDGVWFVDRDQGARAFVAALGVPGEVVLGLDLPATRRGLLVEETLTPDQPWLRDHALLGRPTVPMAVVLDRAARLGAPALAELTLYDGVVVDAPTRVRWRLDGDRFTVHAGERLAWKARIVDGPPSLAPARGGPPPRLTVAEFYREHTFHGPALRGLVSVEVVADDHAEGVVRVGSPAEWGEAAWHLSPLAVDSAFQVAAVWAIERLGRAGFPVGVGRWWQAPLPPGVETLRVHVSSRGSSGDRFSGDVVLTTPDGTVVAAGEGVEAELRARDGAVEVPEEYWNFEKFPQWVDLAQRLEMAGALGVANPYFKVLEGVARDTVRIGDRELIHYSGYNYLGFSGHPYVEARVFEAVRRYGTSVSASRVASGERPIHRELEARLAQALGVEDAVVFTAGHATNVTTIGHLFGPKDLILHDELIHDSALQGMKLSGATRRPFPHGDLRALARMLEQLRSRYEKALIVIEGVYSMDGDLCDLPAAVAIKKRHRAFLMVDEAHSFGVVGRRGYGVSEHFGIPGREVDIWMGTLSKSLSSCGGYIAGSRVLVELLKYTAPGFVYSAGLTPANTMAAIASLELMEREPEHVARLQANAAFFYRRCREAGLDTGPAGGESGVIPVIVGNSFHALLLADALFHRGINVQPILYPAVADNASRLRFFLSALHTEAQLGRTVTAVAEELARIRAEHPA